MPRPEPPPPLTRSPHHGAVRFLGSFTDALPPEGPPEVAFAGRSNVGKSSAINAIVGVGGLARVSKTPGRTQALNVFELAGPKPWRIVDLPGYGHASVAHHLRDAWRGWIETYLARRASLALVVSLIDARVPAQELDRVLLSALVELRVPTLVVATKVDGLSRREREPALAALAQAHGFSRDQLLPMSAKEGEGVEAAREMIRRAVASKR